MTGERLGDFAEHEAALTGAWGEDRGVRVWDGQLALTVPGRLLLLVEASGTRFHAKSARLPAGETPLRLRIQGPNPDGQTQIMLRVAGTSCDEARVPAAVAAALNPPAMLRFRTGWLTDWATTPDGALVIRVLALAAADVASRRNGIWAVKPRHLAALPPEWAAALSRGRRGVMPG
ncbi:MAG TPA: hypothetical protein VD970_11225 [Acetobacteraceae bacterium]|nr:hypothetical protein [Acetobacteraceae bacterium]